MTMTRQGCCWKWLGCFAITNCCTNDMFLHSGEAAVRPGDEDINALQTIGRSKVPIGGGGCCAKVNLTTNGQKDPFAVARGGCCFGGMLSLHMRLW